jgi:hypothetical protein
VLSVTRPCLDPTTQICKSHLKEETSSSNYEFDDKLPNLKKLAFDRCVWINLIANRLVEVN